MSGADASLQTDQLSLLVLVVQNLLERRAGLCLVLDAIA